MAAAAAAAAAPAAAPEAAAATSSSSQNWISSKISEGTFRPPRNVLLQLILRHFWREIGWCFAVSSGFRKGCLAFVFLLLAAAAAAAVTSSQQQLLVSSFRGLLIAAAAAAAATSSTSNSSSRSSSHQQQQSKFDSSRISEGTFRPPRSVLLRLILRHFWHEIRLCFAVSSGFQKGCLAVAFLLSTLVDGSSSRSSSSTSSSSSRSSSHQQQQSKLDF